LAFKQVNACEGTWMVSRKLIEAGRFDEIERLARETVNIILDLKLAHVGINSTNEEEAKKTIEWFAALMNLPVRDIGDSIFAGGAVEAMKSPYLGTHGHIALSTPSVERAIYYLEQRGIEFDEDTRVVLPNGSTKLIYLKGEVAGYAIHLARR